jgi:hypothetical protein
MGGAKMKKLFSIMTLMLLVVTGIHSQIRNKSYDNGTFDAYDVHPQEYIILRDPFLIDGGTGTITTQKEIIPGAILRPSFYGNIWVNFLEYDRGRLDVVDYTHDEKTIYVSVDDIAPAGSAVLPNSVVSRLNKEPEYHWLPAYTLNIVQSRDRDTIFTYEPERKRVYEIEDTEFIWYEYFSYPTRVWITNTSIYIQPEKGDFYSLIQGIDYADSLYRIALSISNRKETFKQDAQFFSYVRNFPDLTPSQPVPTVLLLELNAAQNRMRIYNGETKRIVFDLIKVSEDFYDKYIQFIETNIVPEDLVIPKELLEGWLRDIEISPLYSSQDKKIRYKAPPGTSLYALPDTTSQIIAAFTEGETLIPQEPGLSDVIDGITGRWVWCVAASGETGWYFSAYLESLHAPVSFATETENRTYRSEFNLRLRSRPDTGGTVLVTIPKGTRVKLLEIGKTETVDNISAPWVKVLLEDGREGWCFSGYLKEAGEEPEAPPAAAEPLSAANEAAPAERAATAGGSGGIPATVLIGGGAAIAAAGIFILFVIRRKKKA